MSSQGADPTRRRVLTAAVTVLGGIGVAFAATPFVVSMMPSARARALGAPVEADISRLEPGQMIRVKWRGNPVWIVRRTEPMLATLPELEPRLRDPESRQSEQPDYARNPHRSIRPEVLVLIGICTHLGCSPTFRPEVAPADLGEDWKGGFFCPCHGSLFDIAGRVYAGVPAPTNLPVPPHRYVSDTVILVGEDQGAV